MSLISKIQSLISSANAVTGESRTDLTSAVQDLKDGYGGSTVEKGLVFSEYDSDGFPTKAEIVGMTDIPQDYANSIFYATSGFTKNVSEVILNEGLETIAQQAFTYGNNLKRVTIPSSFITFTGNGAFGNSPFVSVTFLKDVQQIRTNTFANASTCELYDFSHATFVPTLDSTAALRHKNGCVIKVPQSLLATWQNETNWVALTDVTWQGV